MKITLLAVSLVVLAACNSKAEGSDDGISGSEKTQKLRIAGVYPDDHPSTQALYTFVEQVKEKSEGRIEIKVYPANQLGDYTTVYEEIGRGTIDMGLITLPSTLDNRLEMLFVPYLSESYKNITERYNPESYVFSKIQEINNEHNVQLLGFHANGFGGVGTTKEIENFMELGEDKDLLLRVAPIDAFRLPMADIGFRTVTIPYADLYTALQTGSADGWSGGEPALNYLGFRDVIKYYYQTNDFFNTDSLLMNKGLYDELSEKDLEMFKELTEELVLKSFSNAEEHDQEYRDKMAEEGIEVIEFSDAELSEIGKHVRDTTWPKLEKRIGKDIIDELMKTAE